MRCVVTPKLTFYLTNIIIRDIIIFIIVKSFGTTKYKSVPKFNIIFTPDTRLYRLKFVPMTFLCKALKLPKSEQAELMFKYT